MKIEFLWFEDCANHENARELLRDVLKQKKVATPIEDMDVSDPELAQRLRFPGSPTIRINGEDIEPGFEDPDDYTPSCRVYLTGAGLQGVPEREWLEKAVAAALQAET